MRLSDQTLHEGRAVTVREMINAAIAAGYTKLTITHGRGCTLWRGATGYKFTSNLIPYIQRRLADIKAGT